MSLDFVIFSSNMSSYVFKFTYNYWTVLLPTNPTALYLVDIPPSNV